MLFLCPLVNKLDFGHRFKPVSTLSEINADASAAARAWRQISHRSVIGLAEGQKERILQRQIRELTGENVWRPN